jgi:hypothetical protein
VSIASGTRLGTYDIIAPLGAGGIGQVSLTPQLALGARQTLLDLSAYDSGYLHEFDISADGQRFLLIRTAPESRPTRLDVVLNWSEELRTLGGK